MLNSLPWSTVRIDGSEVGATDWKGTLAPGKHNVVLLTGDGREKRTVLEVTSNETLRWCWDFDTGAKCSR